MGDFFSYELITIVFNMTVTAAMVILVVLAARFLLKKIGAPTVVSYALWAVVLFRLLCPVSFTAPFSLFEVLDSPVVTTQSGTAAIEYIPREIVHMENPAVEFPGSTVGDGINAILPKGEEQLRADPLEAPIAILSAIWFCGMAVLVLYSSVSYLRLRKRLIGAICLERSVRLSDHITSPFVMGLIRPKIYLPSDLPEWEREYILLHERHHIRRLDHIIKILAFAALCIHWFNPLVWVAFCLSGKDMEMSCDEAVIQKVGTDIRADYSASLLSLATGRRIFAAMPLAFGEGDTKDRIKNLAKWKKSTAYITASAVLLCLAVIVFCAANNGGQSDLRVRFASGGVEVNFRLGDEVRDWAVYEDVFLDGELCSSAVVMLNGAHPQQADTASTGYYVFKTDVPAADGGGLSGVMQYSTVDENNTVTSRSVDLPREHYTGSGIVLGDGSGRTGRIRRDLRDDGEAVLFSVILSAEPDGVVTMMHRELGVVGANDTVVRYRLVTSTRVEDWGEDGQTARPPRHYGPDVAYVPERCLYMAPYSSYFAAGGDSGYRYLMGDSGFYTIDRRSGAKTMLAEGGDWEHWEPLPWNEEEWAALFWPVGMGAVDISDYKIREYCPLDEGACLLRMDGEIWIVEMGELIHDIYALTQESDKGGAQWEFIPTSSSREPYFRFELDMKYDQLSASCAERMLVDVEGEKARDHALMLPQNHAMYWSPLDSGTVQASESVIRFTALKNGENICFGTIYIQAVPFEGSGRTLYTAHLVGTGLVMEQNPNGGAVIRMK